MDPVDDAHVSLAARRHPSVPSTGSLHYSQHQLTEVAKAFVTVMAAAGYPGAEPLPPPQGREQWSRRHQARNTAGWPVIVTVGSPHDDWIDTSGAWWRLRYDETGALLDAHPLGTPIDSAADLTEYADALDTILRAYELA